MSHVVAVKPIIIKTNVLKLHSEKIPFLLDYSYIQLTEIAANLNLGSYLYQGDFVGIFQGKKVISPISGYLRKRVEVPSYQQHLESYYVIENDYKYKRKMNQKEEKKKNIYSELQEHTNWGISLILEDPYILEAKYFLLHNAAEFLSFISKKAKEHNLKNTYLFVLEHELEMIQEIRNYIGTYPEIQLILTASNYIVNPCEYFEMKHEIVDMHYSSFEEILTFFQNGLKLKPHYITFGNEKEAVVLEVMGGVLLSDLLKQNKIEQTDSICINGKLKGSNYDYFDFIVDEHVKSVIFTDKMKESLCMNCGLCLKACPKKCNPNLFLKSNNIIVVSDCNECGLCNYVCPASIQIKEKIRELKNETKEN